MIKRGKLIVEGNVQGVGYRAYVKKVAMVLGIRGYVKNLDNGTVEIHFETPNEDAYQSFYRKIEKKRKDDNDFAIHVTKITPIEIISVEKFKFTGPFEVDYGMKLTNYEKENLERQEIAILVLSDFNTRTQENFGIIPSQVKKLDSSYTRPTFINSGLNIDKTYLDEYMENKYGAISKTLEELKSGLLKELAEGIKILGEKYK